MTSSHDSLKDQIAPLHLELVDEAQAGARSDVTQCGMRWPLTGVLTVEHMLDVIKQQRKAIAEPPGGVVGETTEVGPTHCKR